MSEELIIRYCSPTLAGIKTGSLFNCPFESREELNRDINRLNRSLAKKGLRVLPLRCSDKKALIYIYRPDRLRDDLLCDDIAPLLRDRGYPREAPDRCVIRLMDRLREDSGFPHEIGLFLGYPPEDVLGFIENGAEHAKCVGAWKVYGDEEKARRLFRAYDNCTRDYISRLTRGSTIDRLAVAQ